MKIIALGCNYSGRYGLDNGLGRNTYVLNIEFSPEELKLNPCESVKLDKLVSSLGNDQMLGFSGIETRITARRELDGTFNFYFLPVVYNWASDKRFGEILGQLVKEFFCQEFESAKKKNKTNNAGLLSKISLAFSKITLFKDKDADLTKPVEKGSGFTRRL